MTISHATNFDVVYTSGNTKEVVFFDDAGSPSFTYLLYQCGTTLSSETQAKVDAGDYAGVTAVPVSAVAVTQTSTLQFLDMLTGPNGAVRDMLKKTTFPADQVSNTCLLDAIGAGSLEAGSWAADTTTGEHENVDVTFGGGYDDATLLKDDDSIFVPFDEWSEDSILGQMDYMLLASVFFNYEKEAAALSDEVKDRIDCVAHNVLEYLEYHDEVNDVKVLWAYYSDYPGYEGWSVGQCSPCDTCMASVKPYYCEINALLGGSLAPITDTIPDYPGWGNLNITEFAKYGRDADVWFYPAANLDALLADPDTAAVLSTFKSVQNEQVYDIQGRGEKDYHEARAAEMDVFMEDFANAVFMSTGVSSTMMNFVHEQTWLRNFFEDEVGSDGVCVGDHSVTLANECVRHDYTQVFDGFGAGFGAAPSWALAAAAAAVAAVL